MEGKTCFGGQFLWFSNPELRFWKPDLRWATREKRPADQGKVAHTCGNDVSLRSGQKAAVDVDLIPRLLLFGLLESGEAGGLQAGCQR